MESAKRLTSCESRRIQILRGIAIFAVVMIHTYPHNLAGVYIRSVINFAVSMFIFLSGYLTKLKYDDWNTFLYKEAQESCYPIYLLVSGYNDNKRKL